jgi:hypothetical protein
MSGPWIGAWALLSDRHVAEFEAAFDEAALPSHAVAIPYPFLRVRVRASADEVLLLMALSQCGQKYRVSAGQYAFPAEWEDEVRDILAFHQVRASAVPSVCYRLELRNQSVFDDLQTALQRLPVFGPTYPRIAVA